MTHADFNDLETRDYIFKIGDRGKGIQARYDKNTDALIFPKAAFDYVYKLLKEALSQEPCEDAISREAALEAVSEGCQEWRGICGRCEELINALPSVTQKSETETWNGIHGQITAPKGTFERIFNEADDDNDI